MTTQERQTFKKIREIADGRRHYDGADGYNCFDALGDIRALCDKALDWDNQKRKELSPQQQADLESLWGV
jgi:hypothetical protein